MSLRTDFHGAAVRFRSRALDTATWIDEVRKKPSPRKSDQDCIDACLSCWRRQTSRQRRDSGGRPNGMSWGGA